MYKFNVPESKKIRLIIDTDAKNEADDQFAIVHALLTPKFDICGIIGAHFGTMKSVTSMEDSCAECEKVLTMMGVTEVKAFRGATAAIKSRTEYELSEGARLIIDAAMKENENPLFVIFLGPITDLACAYLANPEIAGRMTAIWIGGGKYPHGGMEYNLWNDIAAANVIMDSNIPLWQVPSNVYSRMLVSLAELESKVYPYGEVGKYLFEQMAEFNNAYGKLPQWPKGESWSLGDSPAVGLLLDSMDYAWELQPAPIIGDDMSYRFKEGRRGIRVYNDIDARFILEDMFAKLKLNYGANA